jgi:hypothetical protein
MPPAEDGDDRAGSPVKGIKGRKDMHVPKDVWRKHRPPPPRAPDHVEGTGRGGGPTAARVVNGVLRSLSELTMTNPKNLKRWGLGSEDEYFEHVKRRDAAKAALDATLRDPSVSRRRQTRRRRLILHEPRPRRVQLPEMLAPPRLLRLPHVHHVTRTRPRPAQGGRLPPPSRVWPRKQHGRAGIRMPRRRHVRRGVT